VQGTRVFGFDPIVGELVDKKMPILLHVIAPRRMLVCEFDSTSIAGNDR
jgi:hypothetical protein